MDRGKIEGSLSRISADLGFFLPHQVVAEPSFFAPFTATANRREVFSDIVKVLQARNKVELIKKQILASQLKLEKNPCSKVQEFHEPNQQILWNRKKSLEKKIQHYNEEINKEKSGFYAKASSLQTNICMLAEKEKRAKESKQKKTILLIYKLDCLKKTSALNMYIEAIKKYLPILPSLSDKLENKVKKLLMVYNIQELSCCCNLSPTSCDMKMKAAELRGQSHDGKDVKIFLRVLHEHLQKFDDSVGGHQNYAKYQSAEGTTDSQDTVRCMKLDVVRDWLQQAAYQADMEVLEVQLAGLLQKLHLRMRLGNQSLTLQDLSFLDPSECSNAESSKELEQLMKHVRIESLIKRRDCLSQELEAQTWQQNELLSAPPPTNDWDAMQEQVSSLQAWIKAELRQALLSHGSLVTLSKQMTDESEKSNLGLKLAECVNCMKDFVLTQAETVIGTPLAAFGKASSLNYNKDKKVSEVDCVVYGGEHRCFYNTTLINPYLSMDAVKVQMQDCRQFNSLLADMLADDVARQGGKTTAGAVAPLPVTEETASSRFEDDVKEAGVIIARCRRKMDKMVTALLLIRKILRYRKEQPFRNFIDESLTVDGLTLAQYEASFSAALKDRAFWQRRH